MILSIQNIKICSTSFTDHLQYILNLVNFFIQLGIYILLLTKTAFSTQSKNNEQPEPYKLKSLCLNGLNNKQLHVSCNKCRKVKNVTSRIIWKYHMGKHAYAIRGANKLYYCALFTDGLTTLKSLSNICDKGRIKSCCATLCRMQQARLSRDDAVLAFPTLASM